MAAKKKATRKKATKASTKKKATTKKTGAKKTDAKPSAAKSARAGHPLRDRLLEYALTFPDAWEDHPWGESVAKVGKKVFVFFGTSGEFGMAVKLPASGPEALDEPFTEPTSYGLGKSGWVTVKLEQHRIPFDRLQGWVEESYLAVAPKRLAQRWLEEGPAGRPRS